MKVGFLIYGDIDSLSGGYLYDRKLISYLRGQGDSVEIVSLKQRSYLENMLDNLGYRGLRSLDVDILIQDELVHPSVFVSNRREKEKRSYPIVGLVHLISASAPRGFFDKRIRRLVERRYLSSVDGLIFNSTHSREQAQKLLNITLPPSVVAVPAGDNFSDLPGAEMSAGFDQTDGAPLRLIFVGNITRQKGLDVLVRSLSGPENANFELAVAGRSDIERVYFKKLSRLVEKLGLQDRVKFLGPLGPADLRKAYCAADVLVVPSVNEAYGIVYVEAQQFGLPIIGTTTGGAREIIRQGENGFMITPGDAGELARYLSLLHRDRGLLGTLGRNAIEAYRHHPTWEETCGRIRQFLVEMISKSGIER